MVPLANSMPVDNVDQNELHKFNVHAHRWWDKESEFKPLHEINPLRLAYIKKNVALNGKKVLDIGCGGGILTEALAQSGADTTGIDLGDKALKVAELHRLESGLSIDYQRISAEAFAKQNPQSFDVIMCMEMLEHVPDPASVIQACADLVKSGGYVFLSTINRNPKAFMQAIIGAEYVLNMLPKGTHEYAKFITPAQLAAWCRAAGLILLDSQGLTYNPLTKIYSLTDDISVNYMVCLVKA